MLLQCFMTFNYDKFHSVSTNSIIYGIQKQTIDNLIAQKNQSLPRQKMYKLLTVETSFPSNPYRFTYAKFLCVQTSLKGYFSLRVPMRGVNS